MLKKKVALSFVLIGIISGPLCAMLTPPPGSAAAEIAKKNAELAALQNRNKAKTSTVVPVTTQQPALSPAVKDPAVVALEAKYNALVSEIDLMEDQAAQDREALYGTTKSAMSQRQTVAMVSKIVAVVKAVYEAFKNNFIALCDAVIDGDPEDSDVRSKFVEQISYFSDDKLNQLLVELNAYQTEMLQNKKILTADKAHMNNNYAWMKKQVNNALDSVGSV